MSTSARSHARVRAGALALGIVGGLALAQLAFHAGQPLLGTLWLVVLALATWIFADPRAYAWRYLLPGLVGMGAFVLLPMLYTVGLGFTNYSSPDHLHTEERARAILLERFDFDGTRVPFTLHSEAEGLRVQLTRADEAWVSPVLDVEPRRLPLEPSTEPLRSAPWDTWTVVRLRPFLQGLELALPSGEELRYRTLETFGSGRTLYDEGPGGSVVRLADGAVFTPDRELGYFVGVDGERLNPGFRVPVGMLHFARTLTDESFRAPFVRVFLWTILFAGASVLLTAAVGLLLATVLEDESLRGRNVYQTLLFVPYAVPAFISILVFKGLFNQSSGEINRFLGTLLGVRPEWFSDPALAKVMILVVNTWLGFPYVMVLGMGLLKSIPRDLYEAAALEADRPFAVFRRITAPLLIRPLAPLLIASFAFNFNNFALIALLTEGRPDMVGARLPAGTTDILVSYTYRIAFQDAERQFGLAGAISTLIFLLVGLMAVAQLRLARRAEEPS